MFTYGARNAILPNIAGFALALGFVVAGAIVMEIVFSYPGVGYTLVQRGHVQRLPADAGHLPGDLADRADRVAAGRHRLRRSPTRARGRGRAF